jgi:hypothetical protein
MTIEDKIMKTSTHSSLYQLKEDFKNRLITKGELEEMLELYELNTQVSNN